jgi:D-3-phosphoglycerate dehydrogenase
MDKFTVRTYDEIAPAGRRRFGGGYLLGAGVDRPDAIIVRSSSLHAEPVADSVLAIGRAGAGVNNVPVEEMTARGIVVFNAPGANANSVKELVVAAMLLAARNLPAALDYARSLPPQNMAAAVERGKKQFSGRELAGQTLGVVGLGAVGHRVANIGADLGMRVLGYDPAVHAQYAAQLSATVQQVEDLDRLLRASDFVTLHVPLLDSTRALLNASRLAVMKRGAVLLNFARDGLVDDAALVAALDAARLGGYVTDFPSPASYRHPGVITLPHLGASTAKAEANSAVMVADQLRDYLENGNIRFSVNFPSVSLPRKGYLRVALAHKNEPGAIAAISRIVGGAGINIVELINDSRGDVAYSLMELEAEELPRDVGGQLAAIPKLLRLRVLGAGTKPEPGPR